MKILAAFLKRGIEEEPSPMGNFMVGIFAVVLGLWLLLPQQSFAPTLKFGADDPALWGSVQEWHVGLFILALGSVECYYSVIENWRVLQTLAIIATMWWAFVLFGYLSVLPEATAVPIFAFVTLFSAYRYFLFCHANKKNLRNKEKIGNI